MRGARFEKGQAVKILIVEDDAVIAGQLRRHLETWGWECRCARDFRDVLGEFTAFAPQLVLLDIALPFFNGYYWCGEIRRVSRVPIVFLSSAADSMNIVLAMDRGADDFIAKPFDPAVLTAKVQALLRRTYDYAGPGGTLRRGGAVLDPGDAVLRRGERRVELTRNELRILQVLMENGGAIVPRDVLMQRLWETDSFVDENTLSVNVARLRRKLEAAGLPDFIRTKKGLGYQVE